MMTPEPRMKPSAEVEAIFAARAERLARVEASDEGQETFARVATVAVGEAEFGIPVTHLHEIVRLPPIVRLPGQPSRVIGLAQLRGELVSVFDLGRWLSDGSTAQPEFLAVLAGERGALGLAVTRVVGFREVSTTEIAESLAASGAEEKLPALATTRDLLVILDTDRLFAEAAGLRQRRGARRQVSRLAASDRQSTANGRQEKE